MPRFYSKVSHRFWTGETGKKLRAAGRDSQLVALYLVTCQSSNMIGLYYLPLPLMAHEVGITVEGACKALQRVTETGFAYYEAPSEAIFVVEMAAQQIGESLSEKDNRRTGIIDDLREYRKSPFYRHFHARYAIPYGLPEISPLEAPSEPLPSTVTVTVTNTITDTVTKTKQTPQAALVFPPELDSEAFRVAWAEWEQHRAEKKKPLTPLSRCKALKQLAGLGAAEAIRWIDNTIGNSWIGLRKPDAPAPRRSRAMTDEELDNWNPVDGGIALLGDKL